MTITVEKSLLNNQNILQNFGLAEEIDEQAAEIISGGTEAFTIRNKTGLEIFSIIDGTGFFIKPGEQSTYSARNGGILEFFADGQGDHKLYKSYDLDDGQIYEFQDNTYTPNNPYDIDLYRVS